MDRSLCSGLVHHEENLPEREEIHGKTGFPFHLYRGLYYAGSPIGSCIFL